MSKNKNVSTKYKPGTRVQTRDEFLDKNQYVKSEHKNSNDLYRGTYVVASNKNDELVLVKTTTHGGKSPKGTLGDYVEIFDNNGNPIKIDGRRFVVNNRRTLPIYKINEECIRLFKTSKKSRTNRRLVHKYNKGRK